MPQTSPAPLNLDFIVIGVILGTIARLVLLKEDFRRYPSAPAGILIHITIGFVAAVAGALALPTLLSRNIVAVTFLLFAIQQFRDVRKVERSSLKDLDQTEFAPRGEAYIESISKSFEARNYVALIVSLAATSSAILVEARPRAYLIEILIGGILLYLLRLYLMDKTVGDIAGIERALLSFDGASLKVGNIPVMNIGLEATRKRVLDKGMGFVIKPKNTAAMITLANPGQRRAIVSDLARVVGTQRFLGTRRDFETERIGVVIVPIHRDPSLIEDVIRQVPVLESAHRDRNSRKENGFRKDSHFRKEGAPDAIE